MANLRHETVTEVKHWTDRLFSFKTTRNDGFRFKNGHFIMVGLDQHADNDEDKPKRPLMRAYSIASANYEEELEFFSIKVPDGPLTSKLQNIKVGDPIVLSTKATGTLIQDQLLPGKRLFLLATGTGLAPFLSIIRDPEVYEAYEQVVLVHGCRNIEDLAYRDYISRELPKNEYFGELITNQLAYYPSVTREPFENEGRITDLLESGKMLNDLGLPPLDITEDRFMLCGSPSMLKDTAHLLDELGLKETRHHVLGEYVIERAFVES